MDESGDYCQSNKGNKVEGYILGLIFLYVSNGSRAKDSITSSLNLLEFNARILQGRGPKGSSFN